MKTNVAVLSLFFLSASCLRHDPMASARKDIARLEATLPKSYVRVHYPGREVRAVFSGDHTRPALVFVHGSPGSWQGWASYLLDPELERSFHLLAVDRPGFEGSRKGGVALSLSEQARALRRIVRGSGVEGPVVLVGHSFGGPVIAQFALDYPDEVRGVVFLASALDPELEDRKWYQHVAYHTPVRWLLPSSLEVCNDEIYHLRGELEAMRPRLAAWRIPVAIVHGDHDELVPVENVAYIRKHFGEANVKHLRQIPGAGHFIPWEHKPEVLEAIWAIARLPAP